MTKAKHSRFNCTPGCSVEATLNVMSGKWKGIILYHLREQEVMRFNELKRTLNNVTQRMLTNQLRELEDDGLVERTVYPVVPPKVEYRLTELGQGLSPVLDALKQWGDEHLHLFERPSKSAG
jgi:DNA-binding HxlR family transcriptional regulator